MTYRNRAELEAFGRSHAHVVDRGEFYLCRVLGSFWVAVSKSDEGLVPHVRDGFWEPWVMYWVIKNVPPSSRCADLGANVGYYTFLLADRGCHVDAFEPNPAVFKNLSVALEVNTQLQPNVSLWQLAVSTSGTRLGFRVPRGHPMNGGISQFMHEPPGEYDSLAVDASDRLGRESYDFIKIDIEGGERDVFQLLDPQLHRLVLMEFRWDRYCDPAEFAAEIFQTYQLVSYVGFDGATTPLRHPDDLRQRQNEDWMLVLA